MNVTEPSNLIFVLGLILFFRIRSIFIKLTKHESKTVSRFGALEKFLIGLMLPTTLIFPLLYLFTPLLSFADYKQATLLPWLGAAVMIVALWLFWRSHIDLGRNWSVSLEIREGHQLVKQGVYRRIRHPMYSAIWLWAIAQGLILPNWLAGWTLLPCFAAMYFLRILREEGLMCETFGDEYRKYMTETGRLLPRLFTSGKTK